MFAAAHLTPTMSVISHILSITAPLSHTCTTYRPMVLIKKKKTTDISSGKMNKRLMSHFRPQGERVQMNEWSLTLRSNHLCNVTSLVCAHLCQPQRFLFFFLFQAVIVLTNYSFTCMSNLYHPCLSLFLHYPFYAVTPYMWLYSVRPAGAFAT